MVSENNFDKLMEKINYRFKNEEYLKEALTHRSYANENSEFKNFDNEKLEFLGDAVLNLIATEYIYSLGKGKKEGELAKLKSQIISEPVFSSIANDIELGNYLYLSNGEISSGGRKRKSILGDAFEALMGAIFKDSDYYTTKDVALRFILDKLDKLDNFYDRIIEADVHLKLDNTTAKENKIVEVKVHIPGESLVVKKQFKTFEEGIDSAITPLERMLLKYKEKR